MTVEVIGASEINLPNIYGVSWDGLDYRKKSDENEMWRGTLSREW